MMACNKHHSVSPTALRKPSPDLFRSVTTCNCHACQAHAAGYTSLSHEPITRSQHTCLTANCVVISHKRLLMLNEHELFCNLLGLHLCGNVGAHRGVRIAARTGV